MNWLQIQFVTALTLGLNALRTGCEFPLWMHYTLIIYMISFIILFGKFYFRAYMTHVSFAICYFNLSTIITLTYIFIQYFRAERLWEPDTVKNIKKTATNSNTLTTKRSFNRYFSSSKTKLFSVQSLLKLVIIFLRCSSYFVIFTKDFICVYFFRHHNINDYLLTIRLYKIL